MGCYSCYFVGPNPHLLWVEARRTQEHRQLRVLGWPDFIGPGKTTRRPEVEEQLWPVRRAFERLTGVQAQGFDITLRPTGPTPWTARASHAELAILLAMLTSEFDAHPPDDIVFVGDIDPKDAERVHAVTGGFALGAWCRRMGMKLAAPAKTARPALDAEGAQVLEVNTVAELDQWLRESFPSPVTGAWPQRPDPGDEPVTGPLRLIREVVAAGQHHTLLVGDVHSAGFIRSIHRSLPDLDVDAYSTARCLRSTVSRDDGVHDFRPPLRYPHFTVSEQAMFGGQHNIGEMGLSSNGVLGLQDLHDWHPLLLDWIRHATIDRAYRIVTSRGTAEVPFTGQLVATMADPPAATQFADTVQRWWDRCSRIAQVTDICVHSSIDLPAPEESSARRLHRARSAQQSRGAGPNGKLADIVVLGMLPSTARELLLNRLDNGEQLRSVARTARVALTLADLDGCVPDASYLDTATTLWSWPCTPSQAPVPLP